MAVRQSQETSVKAALIVAAAVLLGLVASQSARSTGPRETAAVAAVEALVKAYPEHLAAVEGGMLVWKDGTRMEIDDGKGAKSLEQMLDGPDIKDMFVMRYPLGRKGTPPARDFDPGRVRFPPLFDKMYGNCTKESVTGSLDTVPWVPGKGGSAIRFSRTNGAAEALRKVSAELDQLPARFDEFLVPSAGTFNCRPIAGTTRLSAHGHAVAIDISIKRAHYWRWSKPDADGKPVFRNDIPWEIVEIFERHGFVWGGKWYHYDTMHFEFRPELIATAE